MSDELVIAGRAFKSRLIVGTGKYRSFQEMARAHAASGAEMITVAVRRVNLTDRSKESLLDFIDREKFFILPNTAGCYTADEAIRTARLAREVGLSNWVKLEVIGDQQTLFPDTAELIEATRVLVKEGFVVHQRRSHRGTQTHRCRCRRRHAACRAHWLRPRRAKSGEPSNPPRTHYRSPHDC
jgi:thiazole synthase